MPLTIRRSATILRCVMTNGCREREIPTLGAMLVKRLGKFWLRVAEEETGLVLFDRKHRRKGEPHPHPFDFLG